MVMAKCPVYKIGSRKSLAQAGGNTRRTILKTDENGIPEYEKPWTIQYERYAKGDRDIQLGLVRTSHDIYMTSFLQATFPDHGTSNNIFESSNLLNVGIMRVFLAYSLCFFFLSYLLP